MVDIVPLAYETGEVKRLAVGDTIDWLWLKDAPEDDNDYVRRNGQWVKAKGGGVYKKTEIFTASGTFTLPSTALPTVEYDIIGGGGAGAGVQTAVVNSARGGGGGGGRKKDVMTLTPGTSYAVVVGAGGAGSTSTNGASGGDSTFNGVTAFGGQGGQSINGGRSGDGTPNQRYQSVSNNGLLVSFGSNTWTGGGGGAVSISSLNYGIDGGGGADGICNGGGGGGTNGAGLSAGGGDGGNNTNGFNANTVGSGGGGCSVGGTAGTRSGGSGFRGEVRITYYDTEGPANANIVWGAINPTMAIIGGATDLVVSACNYVKVGNMVTFSGTFSANITTATGVPGFSMVPPIPTLFGFNSRCAGVASAYYSAGGAIRIGGGIVRADQPTNMIAIYVTTNTTGGHSIRYSGSYYIT